MTQSSHEASVSSLLSNSNDCQKDVVVAQVPTGKDVDTANSNSKSQPSWSSKKRAKEERRNKRKQQEEKQKLMEEHKQKLEQNQQRKVRKKKSPPIKKKKSKDSRRKEETATSSNIKQSNKHNSKQKPIVLDNGFDADDESDVSVFLLETTKTKSQTQKHQSIDNDNDDDDETLETPYYQSFAFEGASQLQPLLGTSKANQEPLRPGDVIQYTHPMYVAGNRAGHRVSQIMAIHPHRPEFVLDLDNGELLPKDHRIKRVQEYVSNKTKSGSKLYAHDGIYRNMDDFRWIPGTLDSTRVTGMARQVQQIKAMLAEGKKNIHQKVKQIYQKSDNSSCSSSDDDSDDLFSSRRKKQREAASRRNNNNNGNQDVSSSSNAGDLKLPSKTSNVSVKNAIVEDLLLSSSSSDDDDLLVTQKQQPIKAVPPPSREQQLKEMMDSDYDSDDSSLLIDPFASPPKKKEGMDVKHANKKMDGNNATDDKMDGTKADDEMGSSNHISTSNVQLQALTTPSVNARPKFSLGRCQQSKTKSVQRTPMVAAATITRAPITQQQPKKMPVVHERHGGDDSDSDSDSNVLPPNERSKTNSTRQSNSTTATKSATTGAVKTATSPIDLQDETPSKELAEKVQTAHKHRYSGNNDDHMAAAPKQQQQVETAKTNPKDRKLHPSSIDLLDSDTDDEKAPTKQHQKQQEKQAASIDEAVVTTRQEKHQASTNKPVDQGPQTFRALHSPDSESDSHSPPMKKQQHHKGALDKPYRKPKKDRELNLSSIDLTHSSDSESSLSDDNEDDGLSPRRTIDGKKPFPALRTPTATGRNKQGLSLSQKSDVFEFHSQEDDPPNTFAASGPNSSTKKASPRITPIRVRDVAKEKKKRSSSSTKKKKSVSQLIYEGATSGSTKSPMPKTSPTNPAPSAARRFPRTQADAITGDNRKNDTDLGKVVDSSTVSETSSEFEGESTTATEELSAKQTKLVAGVKRPKQGTEEVVDENNEVDTVSSVGTANSSGSDTSDTEKERRNSTSELRLVTLTSPARKKKQDVRATYTSPLQEAFAAVEQVEAEADAKKEQAFSDPFKSSDEESEASDDKRVTLKWKPTQKKERSPKVNSSVRKQESTSAARKAKESSKSATLSLTVTAKRKKTTSLPTQVLLGSLKESSNPRQQSTREKAVKKTAKASSAKNSSESAASSGEPTHPKKKSNTEAPQLQSQKSNDSDSDDTDWGTCVRIPPKAPTQAPMSSTSNRSSDHVGLSNDSISSGTPASPARSDSSDDSVVVMPKPAARGAQPNISLLTIASKQQECCSPQIEDDSDEISSDDDDADAELVGRKVTPKSGGRLDRPLTDMNGSGTNRSSNRKQKRQQKKKSSSSKKKKMEKARLSGPGRLSFTTVSRSYHNM